MLRKRATIAGILLVMAAVLSTGAIYAYQRHRDQQRQHVHAGTLTSRSTGSIIRYPRSQ